MTALWIVFAVVIVLAALLFGAVLWMYRFAMVRRGNETILWDAPESALPPPEALHVPESMQRPLWEERRWLHTEYQKNGRKYQIRTADNLTLCAHYIPPQTSMRAIILMVHGYRSSGFHDFGGAVYDMSHDGFGCFVIDQRAHGESDGTTITFGAREREDVREWARFLEAEFPGTPVILDGISMGASTVMAAAALALPQNVRAIIADCGYTSMDAIFRRIIRQWFHLPPFPLVPLTSLYCRLKNGFDFRAFSCAETLLHTQLPILIAHGENDHFVPHEMAEEIYRATRGTADIEFFSVPEADHGLSYLVDRAGYRAALSRLYDKIPLKTEDAP